MDSMSDQVFDGHRIRILTVVDEFTLLSPAIEVRHRYRGTDMVDTLERMTQVHGFRRRTVWTMFYLGKFIWQSANRSLLTTVRQRCQYTEPGGSRRQWNELSTIANTGYAHAVPHRSQYEIHFLVEDPNIIYEVAGAPPRLVQREVLPPGTAPL